MGVVTTKSTSITNRDATPQVQNTAGKGASYEDRKLDDYVSIAATDSSTSKYLMVRIPSTAVVKAVTLENTAAGGSCAADCGLFYADDARDIAPGKTAGAAVDADFFATAVSLVSASSGKVDITNESGTYTLDKRDQPIWQAAGLSSDPGGKFDVVLTLTADAASAAKARVAVSYVAP